jgi:protein Mpv17
VDAFFVALTYLSTGITQGHGMKMLPHFKEDFIRSVKAGWATSFLLMPFEFICFRFLPVSLRVLGMNFIDIIWDGVLSFQVHKSRIGDAKNKQTSTTSSTKDLAFVAQ